MKRSLKVLYMAKRMRGSHSLANCAGLKIRSLVVRGFESLPPHHYRFVINSFNLQRKKIAKISAKTCQFCLSASAQVLFCLVISGSMLVKSPTNKIEIVVRIIQKEIPGVKLEVSVVYLCNTFSFSPYSRFIHPAFSYFFFIIQQPVRVYCIIY